MKPYFCLLTLLCFLFLSISGKAQEQFSSRYNLSYVTMENGLLHNFVDDIYKDSHGFLWISTAGGGLSRYDGYEFVNYNINTQGAKLKSNFIKACCEDDFGRLWIASDGGIDILDLPSRQIVIPQFVHGSFTSTLHHPVFNIMKDSKGNIWLYGRNTFYKILFTENGVISEVQTLSSISSSIQEVAMLDVDEDGQIWAGTGNQIFKLHSVGDGKLEAVLVDPVLAFEPDIQILALCLKENELWIGAETGLIRYNKSENIVKRYWYDGNNPRSLTQNHISDLAITAGKQLIVSTLRGLNVYNPVTDDFEQIMQDTRSHQQSLNSNFVNCVLVDGDIIWVGTETGGLNKFVPRQLSVRNYFHNKEDQYSISPNPVNAIYEDTKGDLWVGTVEGGLNKRIKNSERFAHFTEASAKLSHNSVSALVADEHNQLWVGTWGHGITIYDIDHPERGAKKHLSSWINNGMPINFVGSLCYDTINKVMWFGTSRGFYYYDYETDTVYSPFENEDLANTINSSLGAVVDRYGQLWMGCTDGVYVFYLQSRQNNKFTYTHLKYKLDDPTSRLGEKITSFHLDSDGTLWIGSNGGGLYKHIPNEDGTVGKFISYTTDHGLINNNVRGILEDKWKQLWISTNNGLSCFDPETAKFTNYTQNDGLPGNHFYWNACCSSQNGLLYFGTLEGLTGIDPNRITPRVLPNRVTLTRLSVMNQEILPDGKYIDKDIAIARALKLHESDKSFSLEFSALNYESPSTAVYSYRLDGFDDEWVNVPVSRRFASYTNLPAGKYTFQVKYLPDGVVTENSPVTTLQVVVRPFFYKTSWFISLMAIIAICLIAYIYLQRIFTLEKQKERLHRKVEERTHELNEQKLLLEEQTEELSRQNEVLVQQNEQITQQQAEIIAMSQKVQELTMDKISFFTNITHEFRTPITLIIGPIERALKLSYNPQVIEQLNFVERNSKYLLSLVNQLMDFRKVESGKMEIVKTMGNFTDFISSIIAPFELFAANRNIHLRKYIRLNSPEFLFDQDAMHKVITNLLSNGIKFTPDGGTVSLYITSFVDPKENTEKLYVCVRDTGTGIPEDDVLQIFDRFYQAQNHAKYPVYGQSGTGIGLYLCKHIVQLHGGVITAANNMKAGSNFRILLPIEREGEANTLNQLTETPLVVDEEKPQLPSHFVPGRLTILVVEDNADMRSFIRSILIEYYNILEAENGENALDILNRNNVDFIVSDLMMPVMDGIELSRRVKENFAISHIPFLMLTAKTAHEARIESYKIGVDAYLMKPFNEELLLTRIANIIDNRKRYQNRFMNKMDVSVLEMETESGDKKFLDKALKIMSENYKNSYYETSDLIEAMGVSKSLLNKKLQTLTGQSIGQFIRNYRLNLAHELIEKNKVTKSMNISEIAYEVGFNDPKYFTRCFTKRFMVPPSVMMEDSE
ncbi:hybrid sensor histidine kinase/response regulator transcription factor [Bacteroides sp. 519]|uniref:hybrid sensor histidine kinase/response regulator transcription factor n=1 Tax=Bacteroides sp. 519 TaxID=2302937 RepID=UPI0013D269A7|nr:hybrid sensor histidine kinase/response regulator transcription factor [Bacteroides sp. 519]NDV58312.1 response regulator [Bacteroides sp. 519]